MEVTAGDGRALGLGRAFALGLALLGGCSAARGGDPEGPWAAAEPTGEFKVARSAPCGFAVRMPAPMRERTAQDGPAAARIAWGVDLDGSRYEVACFDLPEPLDKVGREGLLADVELGLAGSLGAHRTARRSVVVSGVPAVEIVASFPDEREGQWWVLFPSDRRLLQVSVLGPDGARRAAGAAAFFGSFRLVAEGAPLSSARVDPGPPAWVPPR
jgi:hypothetical protein